MLYSVELLKLGDNSICNFDEYERLKKRAIKSPEFVTQGTAVEVMIQARLRQLEILKSYIEDNV